MHTEPRAARLFLLASRSPRPGDRCRYHAQSIDMPESHQQKLRDRLERMPMSDAPSPWSVIGGSSVGGLTDIGFVPNTDDLLVVSSQGRGAIRHTHWRKARTRF